MIGIIAFDPSLRNTAMVARDSQGRATNYLFNYKPKMPRIDVLGCFLSELVDIVERELKKEQYQICVVEGYSFQSTGSAVTTQAEIGGIIRAVMTARLTVIEMPIPTWRAITINRFGIKPAKATKQDKQRYLSEISRYFSILCTDHNIAEARLMIYAVDLIMSGDCVKTKGGDNIREQLQGNLFIGN